MRTATAAAAAALVVLGTGAGAGATTPRVGSAPPALTASAAGSTAAAPVLRRGDRSAAVLAAQKRLSALGYWLGTPDGAFGPLTEQAVFALQGAAGLSRDGVLGPRTRRALDSGVVPRASTRSGRAVEVVRDAGLVLFVDGGRVRTVLHTSTGTFEYYRNSKGGRSLADTPAGTFRVSWAQDGWRDAALGRLYRPRYFHPDGIAVHGSTSIPAYPASHGCARVSTAAMDMIWSKGLMPIGSTVVVR
ncbi:L,D-transpeptidase family protein [uncultured Pseudokineococcus sp.]|uniref:L,D-transpeptidase family protein n=1 Tax=uncultured Pseudokineococcus sp. TaxID=1642928 RepID=UPI0026055DC1|nr:L,D-transpeptidase family protein [uncultured Pseudokineococcus sp.]